MHLWRFGHYGVPLLVMPSSAGMAHEWQYNGLIETLRPLIEGGRIKLYCSESNVAETWNSEENLQRYVDLNEPVVRKENIYFPIVDPGAHTMGIAGFDFDEVHGCVQEFNIHYYRLSFYFRNMQIIH